MGYQINYGPKDKAIQRRKPPQLTIPIAALVLFVLMITARNVWPEEADRFRRVFLPWSEDDVQAAISECVENVRAGERVGDSITALCMEILNETGLSE